MLEDTLWEYSDGTVAPLYIIVPASRYRSLIAVMYSRCQSTAHQNLKCLLSRLIMPEALDQGVGRTMPEMVQRVRGAKLCLQWLPEARGLV